MPLQSAWTAAGVAAAAASGNSTAEVPWVTFPNPSALDGLAWAGVWLHRATGACVHRVTQWGWGGVNLLQPVLPCLLPGDDFRHSRLPVGCRAALQGPRQAAGPDGRCQLAARAGQHGLCRRCGGGGGGCATRCPQPGAQQCHTNTAPVCAPTMTPPRTGILLHQALPHVAEYRALPAALMRAWRAVGVSCACSCSAAGTAVARASTHSSCHRCDCDARCTHVPPYLMDAVCRMSGRRV